MRVIVCGGGEVGYNIASYLSREDNDVTVIDNIPQTIDMINEELDVNAVLGHASNPEVLSAAGANDADMILAVTQSDEVNMVACQVGHSLFGIPKKIARIREQAYLDPAWSNLFSRAHMPIDVIISPEVIIAQDIYQRLSVPGATFVASFADKKAQMIGVICEEDCPVLNTPLGHLSNLFPDLIFDVVAILRNNRPIIPDATDQLEAGDEAYFIVDARHLARVMAAFGHVEKKARRIAIVGGGHIGLGLAEKLRHNNKDLQIKIIENSERRAQYISEHLKDVVVLSGSGLDKDLLAEANIAETETLVAVTNDDETNILGSLLAKQYGCKNVITLVNNNDYTPLIGPLGIDSMVLPRAKIVATIMQYVRRGRIKSLHNLRDGFAEVIEAEISSNSSLANSTIEEMQLANEVIVGAIVRGDEVIIPKSDTVFKAGDHVIVVASRAQASSVEKMFSVQVDLF